MNRELVIKIVLPRWIKRRWVLVAGALVLGSAAAVYATVPNAFSAGDLLSAQKLNDNFGALVDLTSDQTIGGAKTFSSDAIFDGKVGIGTKTPANLLSVEATDTTNVIGNSTAAIRISNSDSAAIGRTADLVFALGDHVGMGGTNKLAGVTGVYESFDGTGARGALAFSTASTYAAGLSEKVRITSAGSVGIGTSTPQMPLEIVAPSDDLLRMREFHNGGIDIQWNLSSGGGETDLTTDGAGGQGGFAFYNIPAGGSKTEIASIDSAGAFHQLSDARLKTNVRTIENALDELQRLRGVRFNWKQNGKPSIGVIAQEVEAVYPELVSTAPNGTKMVDYASLAGPLIEATKELRAENRALKERIERIEARLDRRAAR